VTAFLDIFTCNIIARDTIYYLYLYLYLIIKYARVPWFGSSVGRFVKKSYLILSINQPAISLQIKLKNDFWGNQPAITLRLVVATFTV
jgi:hypothetical protein